MAIIQYWHSEEVLPEVAELIQTFRDLNPDLRHRLFNERTAEEFIGEYFTRREVAAFRSCAVPAMQADYFRYCAILALGGIYSDADFRCVHPLKPLLDTTQGGLLFRKEPPGGMVNNFFVFRSPGHPMLRLALDVATANIEQRIADNVHQTTGPWIFIGLAGLKSFESFKAAQPSIEALKVEALAETMFRVIGDHASLREAFEDVKIASFERATDWIAIPEPPLKYKRSDAHWTNWHKQGTPIFRASTPR